MADQILNCPPFPRLRWDGDFWSGEVVLPSWEGFQDRSGSYASVGTEAPSDGTASLSVASEDEEDATSLSPEQMAAFQYLIDNEAAVAAAVGRALVDYYPEVRGALLNDPDSDDSHELPEVSEPGGLRPLIGLSGVHVLTIAHDGSAYLGFEFGCVWDEEHGAGVMTHRGRVIDTGQADIAFTEWVAERDPERPTDAASP